MRLGFKRVINQSIEAQVISILVAAFIVVFLGQIINEYLSNKTLDEWILDDYTHTKITQKMDVLKFIDEGEVGNFFDYLSRCHDGYTLTREPFLREDARPVSNDMKAKFARKFSVPESEIQVLYVELNREDFSYKECTDLEFPLQAAVGSLKMPSGEWLNFEIHVHRWHLTKASKQKLKNSALTLLITGLFAVFFVKRTTRPLKNLTEAAQRFGAGLTVDEIPEQGRKDLRDAIKAFNTMQTQVKDSMDRKTNMLTAISHDVRTPLTALRVKVEQVEDQSIQNDLIKSINKIENLTASALDFLRGESLAEELRLVDLRALIESECSEFEELGHEVQFQSSETILYACRSNAMGRAVRNLIENAVKYGSIAYVELEQDYDQIRIMVSDDGPGVEQDQIEQVLKPFERLSEARDSDQGGFGLGLSIVNAIVAGHQGTLEFTRSESNKFQVIIKLPIKA